MAKPYQYRRLLMLALLLLLAFAGLGFRLYHLQVQRHQVAHEEVDRRTASLMFREPRRGDILDARGNLLATSRFVKTVCADPSLLGTNQILVARVLAPLLGISEAELRQKLQLRTWINSKNETRIDQHVILKRKVLEEEWLQIRSALTNLNTGLNEKRLPRIQREALYNLRNRAIFVEPIEDQLRVYPHGPLAAHVVGYVGGTERATAQGTVIETTGLYGVEQSCHDSLTGARGWRQTVTDRRRRELVTFREEDVAPRPGLNVVLTIDAGLQDIVEAELGEAVQKQNPVSATAIVVQPATGRVLAMANWPTFDPNRPGDSALDALRNRAISDTAEPGSTFKIVVVSGALNDGLTQLTERFDCENGAFGYGGRTLHDHRRYEVLSVEEIVFKSSNIGAAKIGLRMGSARLHEYIRGFGFGERTQIPLSGEVRGTVHPLKEWTKLSTAWIPMGHEVAVTPLQMVMAMAAIANRGLLMRPLLVERLVDEQGRTVAQFAPQPVRQVIKEAASRQMIQALKEVVSTNGTAPSARLEHYLVAGKTGTAQKLVGGRYSNSHHYSSFIGFFPADEPELCILVVLDDPKQGSYGGETAGPVFRRIAERSATYLSLRSTAPVNPSSPAAISDASSTPGSTERVAQTNEGRGN